MKKDPPVSDNGKVHDLVFRMCEPFLDNWSPILYHDLRKRNTGSCGTVKANRIGFPNGFARMLMKEKGDRRVFTYGNEMQVIKIHDRKPVTLLSTTFTATPRDSGRKHWKTKETIEKPEMMLFYNKYMGGVDVNDQLLKYCAFDYHSMKWWKKVAFRLINIPMVNAFILYKEWFTVRYPKCKPQPASFRLAVIKQLLAGTSDSKTRHVGPDVNECS